MDILAQRAASRGSILCTTSFRQRTSGFSICRREKARICRVRAAARSPTSLTSATEFPVRVFRGHRLQGRVRCCR